MAAQLTSSRQRARDRDGAAPHSSCEGWATAAGASGPSGVVPTARQGRADPALDAPRWWVLALPLATFALGVALAFGSPRGVTSAPACCPTGRAGRLLPASCPAPSARPAARAGHALGWATVRVHFAASGAATKGVGQLCGTSSALQREFTRLGGQAAITNAYLAALMLLPAGRPGTRVVRASGLRREETADADRAQRLARTHTERTRSAYHRPRGA